MTIVVLVLAGLAAALLGLAASPLLPTVRAALLLGAAALVALVSPPVAIACAVGLGAAAAVDAWVGRHSPGLDRQVPPVLARGVGAALHVGVDHHAPGTLRVRQPVVADLEVDPQEGDGGLDATVTGRRRGLHVLPPPAARVSGPLGLAAWYREGDVLAELAVYPDLPAARRLALAVRQGRFREPGRLTRGPLGLGTDFESIRDYLPDDDVRQINWRATERTGRPMSNQYRVEQDRDVIGVLDCGRLMSAPIGDRTRLDAAVDALAAVALVADEVGDRCGVVAFDAEVRRQLRPRRSGGDAVVRATFDLEPMPVDADYDAAFRAVGGVKRAFVLLLTDLLDEAAAHSLLDAMPILARRHAVAVASVTDPEIHAAVTMTPRVPTDVFAAGVALDLLGARERVAVELRRHGVEVVEADASRLGASCVGAYLRAKARARL